MPKIPVLDAEGHLRWDASCILIATIMVPDEPDLRKQYEAVLRRETAEALPDGEDRLGKRDWVLSRSFDRRPRIEQEMQTRRIGVILAGAMLWDLHTATDAHPEIASKNKIEFIIDRVSIAAGTMGTRATLRKVWRQFRPVIHWCAALAYQGRVFGCPLPQNPAIGYVGSVVIFDFLTLGNAFLAFARKTVRHPEGAAASFWTSPEIAPTEPRRFEWPNAYALAKGFTMDPEFVQTAGGYAVETLGIIRDPIAGGLARRFSLGKPATKARGGARGLDDPRYHLQASLRADP